MFATRANQENAVHQQQTATAAKNQNLQGLAPKTPGLKPKTPFKANGNDENAAFGPGKTGGKGKDGGLFGEGKGGKADQSAFMTPAGMLCLYMPVAETRKLTICSRPAYSRTTRRKDNQCESQCLPHPSCTAIPGAALHQAHQPAHAQRQSQSPAERS